MNDSEIVKMQEGSINHFYARQIVRSHKLGVDVYIAWSSFDQNYKG